MAAILVYPTDLPSAYEWLEEIAGVPVRSEQDVQALKEKWEEANPHAFIIINEFMFSGGLAMWVKRMTIHEGERADLSRSSNFHKTGNVAEWKNAAMASMPCLSDAAIVAAMYRQSRTSVGIWTAINGRPLSGGCQLPVSSYIIPADTPLFLLAAKILLYRQA